MKSTLAPGVQRLMTITAAELAAEFVRHRCPCCGFVQATHRNRIALAPRVCPQCLQGPMRRVPDDVDLAAIALPG